MALIDKLRDLRAAPADADLLDFLGVGPSELRWTKDGLTVGGETIPMSEARDAVLGGPIRTDEPRRAVEIKDL